jgi:NAD dependent epimerase/dehydratase family enzyme
VCWCAGGPLGSGKQWVSWIHRDDLVDLIIDSIRNSSYAGVYNGTAPKPVTMAQLCSAVGGVMGRPSWLPVPDFAITTLLGEGAQVCG